MFARILTLFPDSFPGLLGHGLAGKALQNGLWNLETVYIRDFATDRYGSVDDTPFGGGAGMVLRADILEAAHLSQGHTEASRNIFLSPRGKPLTQNLVAELATCPHLTLLCGRYEGVDQRFLDAHNFEEISIGDYILSGGELAAQVLLDACIRLIPKVLGNPETLATESFEGGLLEHNQYTRPAVWTDSHGTSHPVPEVLKNGNHAAITAWQKQNAETLTQTRRPDLWQPYLQTKKR